MLLAATAIVVGCGSDSPTEPAPTVAGSVYVLQRVNGAVLPARYEPADLPGTNDVWQISSAVLQFVGNAAEGVEVYRAPGLGPDTVEYAGSYQQTGNRVLMNVYPAALAIPPDTATVDGNLLTVRAQFFRETRADRYVLEMVYRRQ